MRGPLGALIVTTSLLLTTACSGDDDASATDPTTADSTDRTSEPEADADSADTDDSDASGPDDGDGGAAPSPSPDDVTPFEPAPLEWEQFNEAVDVSTLTVPVDYGDPDGPTFELKVARYNAIDQENRIGSLLINPGGPGFGGSDFAFFASQIFDRPLLERFDIIGWDPRGTGESEPAIDCIDDYDTYFTAVDSTPDSDEERQAIVDLSEQFANECLTNNAEIIEHVGTNNSARDMDSIRRALGEDTISYFGFSYGSELGAAWATLFPDTVRAAVFDGAADPTADSLESGLQQRRGFEAALTTFLGRCSARPECAFHNDGDAEGALDELLVELDENPLPSDDGRPPVNRDVALTGIVQAMYTEDYWPALEESLAGAAEGDGSGLLELNDSYYRRAPDGTYGNELEAFPAISCADSPERRSIADVDADQERFTEAAPRLSPEGSVGGYFCTFFPPAIDPRVDIDTSDAPTIVVIGTSGDSATPLESTETMAGLLGDGRLVIVEADQHTGYGVNRCVLDVVNDYLIDLILPPDGTTCDDGETST